MKGRNRFIADEISQLKSYIRKKQSAPAGEQKRWRDKMRALGFYISDFQGGSEGFSDRDFDRLIERGAVEVVDQPSTGGPAKKAAEPKKESGAALSGGAGRVFWHPCSADRTGPEKCGKLSGKQIVSVYSEEALLADGKVDS